MKSVVADACKAMRWRWLCSWEHCVKIADGRCVGCYASDLGTVQPPAIVQWPTTITALYERKLPTWAHRFRPPGLAVNALVLGCRRDVNMAKVP